MVLDGHCDARLQGQVYYPHVIRGQLLFQRNTMLKMFLSAAATSTLIVALLRALGLDRVSNEYTTEHPRGVPALCAGGCILVWVAVRLGLRLTVLV